MRLYKQELLRMIKIHQDAGNRASGRHLVNSDGNIGGGI